MGQMMLMVAELEGLDGVVSAEPSSLGIVVEATDLGAVEEWLDPEHFTLRDDVEDRADELRASNREIDVTSEHELRRVVSA